MNSYDRKVEVAKRYVDAVYRIESMRNCGVTGLYGLEQHRLSAHEDLCAAIGVDREKSKQVCDYMDREIGFDINLLEEDFEYWIEKLASRLVQKLAMLC